MTTLEIARRELREQDDRERHGVRDFRQSAVRPLNTAEDGRRFAIDVLKALREAGPEGCRCHGKQTECLIAALLVVKERASLQATLGFGVVMTDAAGTRGPSPVPEFYEQLEREKAFSPFGLKRLRRLVDRGLWSAAIASKA